MSVGGGRVWFVVGAVLLIRSAETLRAERPGCGLWTNTVCFLLERRGVGGFFICSSLSCFSVFLEMSASCQLRDLLRQWDLGGG